MKLKRVAALALIAIVILVPFSLRIVHAEKDMEPGQDAQGSSLRKHPIYSTYQFPRNERIIHFGTQPLTVFMGNIGELIRRDAILHEELAKLGFRINIHAFLKGQDLAFFLREKDLQGGMLGDMPTLRLVADTEIMVPALCGEGFASIVAIGRMPVCELRGKRVGIAFGSAAHGLLLEALKLCGIAVQDVRLVLMEGDKMPRALANGEIDAFSGWEPQVAFALNLVKGSSVIHRGRYVGFTCFRKEFVKSYQEVMCQLLAAQVRALRFIWSDEKALVLSCRWTIEESKRLIGPSYNVSPDLLAQVISRSRNMNLIPLIPETDLRQTGHLDRMLSLMKGLGLIPSGSVWTSIANSFDRTLMIEVLSDSRKYRLSEMRYDERDAQ